MNKVILMGRLTRDPEIRYSQGAEAVAVCRYSLAVNRSYKRDGEPDADFFNLVAFGKRGEFAEKYFKKGMMVAIVGELRNNSYSDKDGNKRYSTEIVVSEQHFADSNNRENSNQPQAGNSDFAPPDAGYPSAATQQQPVSRQRQANRPTVARPAQPNQQPVSYPQDQFTPYETDAEDDLPF